MFKTIAIASIAAAAAFAIAVGCSSPDAGGYVKSNGNSRGDDDDTSKKTSSSSGSAATSSGSTPADCTKLPPADKNAECDKCTKAKCCQEYANCQTNAECQAQAKCVGDCASGDIVCLFGCQASSDEATALGTKFGNCLNANCKSECAGSAASVDGGDNDPFGDI